MMPAYLVKRKVRERDRHRCTGCGMTNEEHLAKYDRILSVHRVVPGSVYVTEGCVTVCEPCHREAHKVLRGPPRKVKTIRVSRRVMANVRRVAGALGIPTIEYVSKAIQEAISRDIHIAAKIALEKAKACSE